MDVVLAHADEHVAFQINPVRRGIVPGEISFQDVVSPLKDNPALRLNDGIVAERDQFVRLKIPRSLLRVFHRYGEHIRSGIRMDRRTKKKRQQSYGRANRFCHKPEHSARQGHNHGHGKLPVASSVRTHYKNAPHRSVFKRITPQQRFFCITRTNCRTLSRSLSTSASLAGVPFEKQCGVYSSPFFKQKKPSVIPRRRGAAKKRGSFFRFIHNFSAIRNGGCFHARLPSRILVPVFSPAKRLSVEVPCF